MHTCKAMYIVLSCVMLTSALDILSICIAGGVCNVLPIMYGRIEYTRKQVR